MNDLFSRFRLLPLLVLVAMAAFAVRVGEAVVGVKTMAASAIAAEEKADPVEPGQKKEDAKKEDAKSDEKEAPKKADAEKPAAEGEAAKAEQPKVSLPDATLPEVWADPGQEEMSDSPEQMRLLEDLAKRRQMLDEREKALNTRQALMAATEKQIDDKIDEMTALKDQIEKLLGQQEGEESKRVQSLVKIYEGMKAKDAAEIFNQMDMSVLLQVISKMSERKSAPIIAAMDTAKANELTVRLTEMQKLPEQQNSMGGPMPTSAPTGSASLPGLDALGQP